MREDNFNRRFGGIARLYGDENLQKLQQAHFCVVGIGGVGSWTAEALARSGVGKITLIDMDDICVTNVNRQIHAVTENIGKIKTEVMADRIKSINVECEVVIIDDFLTASNIKDYIKDFDVVIDAIDSVQTKAALIAYCKRNKIRIISTGGAGGKLDPTQIQIADITKTIQDPLISKTRRILRSDYNFSKNPKRKFGIDCVFSTEMLTLPQTNGCAMSQTMNCSNGFGSITMVTATFGFFAASKAIERYLQR